MELRKVLHLRDLRNKWCINVWRFDYLWWGKAGALDSLLKKEVSGRDQRVAGALDSILKNGKVVSLMMVRDSTFIGTCVVIYCLEKAG